MWPAGLPVAGVANNNEISRAEDQGITRAAREHEDAIRLGIGHAHPFSILERKMMAPTQPLGIIAIWNPPVGTVINRADLTTQYAYMQGYIRHSRRLRGKRQRKDLGEFGIGPPRSPAVPAPGPAPPAPAPAQS